MTVRIRVARASDKEACIELLQELSDVTGEYVASTAGDAFDSLLDGGRGLVLVAEDDGELLGLATLAFTIAMRFGGEYCRFEEVVVEPSARGKGIGRMLVDETIARAKARGCVEIGAYLTEIAKGNQSFYEKFDFEHIGVEMRRRLG